MRKAIGIWQAMLMILLVSGMLIVTLKYASISAKHTADSYIREQAELYLASTVEKTLYGISVYDRSGGSCFKRLDDTRTKRGVTYNAAIEVERYYMYNETCSNVAVTPITASESHGYAMLRIEVNATIDGEVKIRILRRSLQRP